jgi:hypothetical protein
MKKLLISIAIIASAGIITAVFFRDESAQFVRDIEQQQQQNQIDKENEQQEEDVITPAKVLIDVPFIPQAPTAKWSDPRQQDGCEEASILMAHLWLTGKTMTLQRAEQEIIAVSDYQQEKYGEFVDRSIVDTGKLFEEYYKHDNYQIKRKIDVEDIKQELAKGNIVIIPTNGQILANPNYTAPGPLTHMLPIIGYDDATGDFITNDPGTRNGRHFKFKYDHVIDSIYEYETGAHEGYHKTDTVMMVVEKDS